MLPAWLILACSFGYLSLLFAIAYYGDKRADSGKSLIANPLIYALSIAVYCTSWTFYGSVGRASTTGLGFLPVYLGPTLTFLLGWFILRKIVRITKTQRITSIADFISSRYGKSHLLGGLVTIIAVIGIMPYISIQLKGVSASYAVLVNYPDIVMASSSAVFEDTAFYVALFMAAFSILFGTRHIDATEHHEGMVAAIAFESVIKLVAFLAVGLFVTFGLFDGFGDLFTKAAANPDIAAMMTLKGSGGAISWVTVTFMAMIAIFLLPRQFQVAVVENVEESHIKHAVWLFPLYLLIINIFVLPIAFGGLLSFPSGAVDADTFVLALPLSDNRPDLALLVFIGGLSAATGMVIVASISLSTMVCNDMVMPILIRFFGPYLESRGDISKLLLLIRRLAIIGVLLLGYGYFRLIGESYALAAIGLVSFAAAAQFAPALLGGAYWKNATRSGALAGLVGGFIVWGYTLLLPSFARSGWLSMDIIEQGLFGQSLLTPYALFGLSGFDPITHAMIWTMIVNVGLFISVSLFTRQSPIESIQAKLFVDVFDHDRGEKGAAHWRGSAKVEDLRKLAARFVGQHRSDKAFQSYARSRGVDIAKITDADPDMVHFTERMLAGAIGAASARVSVASVVKGEAVTIEEMMVVLDEASQVIEYSRQLEQKSRELEQTTKELRQVNLRLQELDRLKDEFLSTITHELRTPLTSIRSLSEILHGDPNIPEAQRTQFVGIIVKESERLTRLINQVLDFAKMEQGRMDWDAEIFDVTEVINNAIQSMEASFKEKGVTLSMGDIGIGQHFVDGDRDALTQVIINLMSNAGKFADPEQGEVGISIGGDAQSVLISVRDNGCGIDPADHGRIFDKFHQVRDSNAANPMGTGLGLAITKTIIDRFKGSISVDSKPGKGATFNVLLPRVEPSAGQ